MPACCEHQAPLVMELWTQVLTSVFGSCRSVLLVLGCHKSSPFPFLPTEQLVPGGLCHWGSPAERSNSPLASGGLACWHVVSPKQGWCSLAPGAWMCFPRPVEHGGASD